MLKSYIIIAFRNLVRQKLYMSINVLGLAIGLACCLLLAGVIFNELSFEDGHANKDHIYRVDGQLVIGESQVSMANIFPNLGPAMQEAFPEVRDVVRLRRSEDARMAIGEIRFSEETVLCAEPSLFDIFTMPLQAGNPETALDAPFTVVISDKVRRTYFPDEDPIGRTIRYLDQYDLQVTGVLEPFAHNSQLNANYIFSYASLAKMNGQTTDSWSEVFLDYTYLLLADEADPATIEVMIPALIETHAGAEQAAKYQLQLQPLKDIYLHSSLSYELPPRGSLTHIYMFSVIALVILIIASANFINLTTARTSHRMKEVGVRKVLGAHRGQLVRQFLSESIIMTCIAMLVGLWLFEMAKPELETFLARPLALGLLDNSWMLVTMAALILLVGLLSGSYPALLLSRFRPIAILKGGVSRQASKTILRRFLVVFQFTLAIILICGTLIIYKQIDYAASKDLGFAKKDILVINMIDNDIPRDKLQIMKSELLKSTAISAATTCGAPPGESRWTLYRVRPENKADEAPILINMMNIDVDFLSLFEIPLTDGRTLTAEDAGESPNTILINRFAIEEFNIDEPLGFRFLRSKSEMTVVGVVENFNNLSLHNSIHPLALSIVPAEDDFVAAKIIPGGTAQAIADATDAWNRILPDFPIKYSLLEDMLRATYEREQQVGSLFIIFTVLAVLIASLGIFGLAAYSAEQRTKEFGIRKVLGASIVNIMRLLFREFLWLVVAASFIAWPVAYYLGSRWLEQFAYRTDVGWWTFVSAGLLTLVIALATASFHALRAALANPVDSIKYE